MTNVAVIGGTGFSQYATHYENIDTDFGSVEVGHLALCGKDVAFIHRHKRLEIPRLVNYRANTQALKLIGVEAIYAISAAGKLHEKVHPGNLGIIDDIVWFGAEAASFATPGLIIHATGDHLFSPTLNRIFEEAAISVQTDIREIYATESDLHLRSGILTGTYFHTRGPGFNTPDREAGIRRVFPNALFIGQTLLSEAYLAQEMGIFYAALAMCVDNSKFFERTDHHVTHADGVMDTARLTSQAAYKVIEEAVKNTPPVLRDSAYGVFSSQIHPDQFKPSTLRKNGMVKLADIIEAEFRKHGIPLREEQQRVLEEGR